ncbi:MAG: dual specificity protein phosphatase family protein [Nocardioidaceae bacterium]|nr:dual specificity protein phosphatase family protein [Nocardioidaceae bacterium]
MTAAPRILLVPRSPLETAIDRDTQPRLRVANADFVTPRLLVGGDLDYRDEKAVAQLAELVSIGVTHIVDARIEASDEDFVAARVPAMAYLHHGVDDAGQRIPAAWFDVGVDFAVSALEDDPDAMVLSHCHMGINRGPSLGFAILLAQGWNPMDALNRIRTVRPIAFVAYAEDALHWHHGRTGGSSRQLAGDLRRLAEWREANELDIENVIRGIRRQEARGL